MTWARLDDGFWSHPKVEDLREERDGLAAIGLWTLALSRSYSPRIERPTITEREVHRLAGRRGPALAELLVRYGLWEKAEHGWAIHDWANYRSPWDSPEARLKGGLARAATAMRDELGRFRAGAPLPAAAGSPAAARDAGPAAAGPADQQDLVQLVQLTGPGGAGPADQLEPEPEPEPGSPPLKSPPTPAGAGLPGDDRDALDRYYELTMARPWGRESGRWLTRLQDDFGVERVVAALDAEWSAQPEIATLLSRVEARLARAVEKARAKRRTATTRPTPPPERSPEERAVLRRLMGLAEDDDGQVRAVPAPS